MLPSFKKLKSAKTPMLFLFPAVFDGSKPVVDGTAFAGANKTTMSVALLSLSLYSCKESIWFQVGGCDASNTMVGRCGNSCQKAAKQLYGPVDHALPRVSHQLVFLCLSLVVSLFLTAMASNLRAMASNYLQVFAGASAKKVPSCVLAKVPLGVGGTSGLG